MKNIELASERERRVWMTLRGDFKKRGAALLHQQCGCWGYDVRREIEGRRANLLLEWGFERLPPPAGIKGATTYSRREDDGTRVTLWAFGLGFGDDDGQIFVSRFAFWPRWSPLATPPRAWTPKQVLETMHAPRRAPHCLAALERFGRALSWIAAYETRVAAELGVDYRAHTLHQWSHRAGAPDLPQLWQTLSRDCAGEAQLWQREGGKTRSFEPIQKRESAF